MIIYLDTVIAINLFMNFFIFYMVKKIVNKDIKIGRVILGTTVATGVYIISIIFNLIILGFISIIFGILVTFKRHDFFKALVYSHACAFLIGGMVTVINNYGIFQNFSILILISSTTICYIFIVFFKKLKKEYYKLEIYIDGEKKVLKAFLDTGNSLTFEKMPVIIVTNKKFETYKRETFIEIPYKTVAEEGFLKAFIPEKITLNEKEILAFIAISEINLNKTDALIGPSLVH